MATVVGRGPLAADDNRFFLFGAFAMAFVLVAGFSLHLAFGRSSFSAPAIVHAHGVVFFGWVVLYVTQTMLATSGSIAWHRRLGWIAAGWMVAMVVVGTIVAVEAVRLGRAAPVYRPAYFLVMAPLTVYTFAALSTAAIVLRRHSAWHKRLHFCGMAMLVGPGLGRLLPLALLVPHAGILEFVLVLLFPLAGVVADWRRSGRVHPAWWWGIGTILAVRALIGLIVASGAALWLHGVVTAGQPGAALPPFEFPPLPLMP